MNETIAPALTPAERKVLKANAHHLKPVVMVGDAGLTDAVLAEADRALAAHALIKVRVLGDEREARAAMMEQLCAALDCAPVQTIGKLLVLYRPRPDSGMPGSAASPKKRRKPSEPHVPKKSAGARSEEGKPARPPVQRRTSRARSASPAALAAGASGARKGFGTKAASATRTGKSATTPRTGKPATAPRAGKSATTARTGKSGGATRTGSTTRSGPPARPASKRSGPAVGPRSRGTASKTGAKSGPRTRGRKGS